MKSDIVLEYMKKTHPVCPTCGHPLEMEFKNDDEHGDRFRFGCINKKCSFVMICGGAGKVWIYRIKRGRSLEMFGKISKHWSDDTSGIDETQVKLIYKIVRSYIKENKIDFLMA